MPSYEQMIKAPGKEYKNITVKVVSEQEKSDKEIRLCRKGVNYWISFDSIDMRIKELQYKNLLSLFSNAESSKYKVIKTKYDFTSFLQNMGLV